MGNPVLTPGGGHGVGGDATGLSVPGRHTRCRTRSRRPTVSLFYFYFVFVGFSLSPFFLPIFFKHGTGWIFDRTAVWLHHTHTLLLRFPPCLRVLVCSPAG